MSRKYIIIIGSGRTGTTALSKKLSECNEKIALLPELKYFYLGLANRNIDADLVSIYKRSLEKFLKFNQQYTLDKDKSIEKFVKYIEQYKSKNKYENYRIILEFFIDELLSGKKYEYYILQTPSNLLVLDLINKTLNNIYIIYTIRDVRSFVVSAYKGKLKWADSLVKLIAYWNFINDILYKYNKKYKGILVKQEELLFDEKNILESISNFLQIEFKCKRSNELINSSFGNRNKEDILIEYKKYFSSEEIDLIEYFSKKNLQRFNYDYKHRNFHILLKNKFEFFKSYLINKIFNFFMSNGLSSIYYRYFK